MRNRGYTLVEILIATSIFVAVVGIAVATFNSASGFQSKTQAIQETNQAARFVIEKIARDIRSADGKQKIKSGGTNYTEAFGYAILNNQDELSIEAAKIIIIKKGQGTCSKYKPPGNPAEIPLNQITSYFFDNSTKKIVQNMYYVDSTVDGISPYSVTGCQGNLTPDLIGNRADAKELKFSGLNPIQTVGQEPYAKIELKVRSFDYDNVDSTERAAVDLQTTVIPRLDGFKNM